jgi:hypothetical protein
MLLVTVVEHMPHHPRVEGSSPAIAASRGREKCEDSLLDVFDNTKSYDYMTLGFLSLLFCHFLSPSECGGIRTLDFRL